MLTFRRMQPRCRGIRSRAVRADSVGIGEGLVRADVEVLVGEERCHLVEERRDNAERHILLSSKPKTLSFRPLATAVQATAMNVR